MSKTENNIEEAFSGESKARSKYTFFAEKAEEEGKSQIAKLFRAAALAEEIHAGNHFKTMDGLKTTKENLLSAIQGENYEHTEMYPEFVETAQEESKEQAEKWFDYALKVEKKHEEFYREALEAIENDNDLSESDWFVCEVCGNTVRGEAPENCPICGAPREKFQEVD
ncbi:MAG: rubrerythrin family protein [Hadesarchaea archaeon]|nr:rubrerythrin family protein [Hadesarchaea archaeon]